MVREADEIWFSAAIPETARAGANGARIAGAEWTLTVTTPVSHTLDHFSS